MKKSMIPVGFTAREYRIWTIIMMTNIELRNSAIQKEKKFFFLQVFTRFFLQVFTTSWNLFDEVKTVLPKRHRKRWSESRQGRLAGILHEYSDECIYKAYITSESAESQVSMDLLCPL